MRPGLILIGAWAIWGISWLVASLWTGRTRQRIVTWQVWLYRSSLLIGAVLLYHRTAPALGASRLWHVGYYGAYALVGAAILGFLFTWWARIHLGKLWSGAITLKEDHKVIDTGPYSVVRHPIYTGILIAIFCTAVAEATWPAIASLVFMTFGLWLKADIEERLLANELGSDAYGTYRHRVPMLVPFASPAAGDS